MSGAMKAMLGAIAWLLWSPTPALAQSAASDHTFATRYDLEGRVTGTIAPDPDGSGPIKYAAVRSSYDARGLLTRVEKGELDAWQPETATPAGWPGFTIFQTIDTDYDLAGRKLRDTVKGSDLVPTAVTQYSYDAAGALECTAVRMNPAVYGSLPASACTLGMAGSFGPDRITRSVYNAKGQLEKVQKAVGTSLQQDYVSYTYTLNGKQATVTDANGAKAAYTYDMLDRLVRWSFPSKTTAGVASTSDYEDYGYDANGNRTSLRKRDGSVITYQYDALNRNSVKIVPERPGLAATHTRDVHYGYDLRGLQLYARFDSIVGEGVTTAYDSLGRPTSSTLTMDGAARPLSYQWDRNGNRSRVELPNSVYFSAVYDGLDRQVQLVEYGSPVLQTIVYTNRGPVSGDTWYGTPLTQFGYDPAGRIDAIHHNPAGPAQDVSFSYGYTPANQIAQRVRDNDIYAWSDSSARTLRYTVNGLNQYTSVGSSAYSYDANGNLASDGPTTYIYDVENRLVGASGAVTAALRYDPLGRLYETIGSSNTTRFLHDGDELVAEYDGAGSMLRFYAHGRNVDDPVAWYEYGVSTPVRRLIRDHQGSVIAVLDGTGAAIQVNRYDEWGVPAVGNLGRFQYTGQAWIPELGMYYYKARIYSPMLGRFMQTDPIGYDDQVNLYAYVGNDPVNGTDPTGQHMDGPGACGSFAVLCLQAGGGSSGGGGATGSWGGGGSFGGAGASGSWGNDAGSSTSSSNSDSAAPWADSTVLTATFSFDAPSATGSLADAAPEGVAYSRIDMNGGVLPYGGQVRSYDRYLERQIEHARNYPNADFEFTIVNRARPGIDLDVAEHNHIQELTCGFRASQSPLVSNKKDPVGRARRRRLGLPEPGSC